MIDIDFANNIEEFEDLWRLPVLDVRSFKNATLGELYCILRYENCDTIYKAFAAWEVNKRHEQALQIKEEDKRKVRQSWNGVRVLSGTSQLPLPNVEDCLNQKTTYAYCSKRSG
jgi:hypothetical protein